MHKELNGNKTMCLKKQCGAALTKATLSFFLSDQLCKHLESPTFVDLCIQIRKNDLAQDRLSLLLFLLILSWYPLKRPRATRDTLAAWIKFFFRLFLRPRSVQHEQNGVNPNPSAKVYMKGVMGRRLS